MLSGFMVLVHVLISGLMFIDEDSHYKHHDYAGFQGATIVLIRLIMLAGFVWGVRTTFRRVKQSAKPFLRTFTVAGCFYLSSFPVLFVVSYLLDPYVRA